MRRNVPVRSFELRYHAAEMREFHTALEKAPGLHHLVTGIVYRRGAVIHAADQCELVGNFRSPRKHFRYLDPRHVRFDRFVRTADLDRSVRLHIEGVELRRPADQHQEDAIRTGAVIDRASRFEPEELAEAEPP